MTLRTTGVFFPMRTRPANNPKVPVTQPARHAAAFYCDVLQVKVAPLVIELPIIEDEKGRGAARVEGFFTWSDAEGRWKTEGRKAICALHSNFHG